MNGENSTSESSGAIWIAFGPEFLLMAIHSAYTFRMKNPGRGTAVVTNMPVSECRIGETDVFDHVTTVEAENRQAFQWKLRIDSLAPFDKVIFLDADTEIRRDMSPVFRLLERYPLAICPREKPCNKKGYIWEGELLAEAGLREFNSGVFAFDRTNDSALAYFERVRAIFDERNATLGENVDQPSFTAALYQDPTFNYAPLSVEWNATNRRNEARSFIEKFPDRVGVYHYREPLRHGDVARNFVDTAVRVRLTPHCAEFERIRPRYSWPARSPVHRALHASLRFFRRV